MQRCSAYHTKTMWRWEHANKVPPWKKTFRRTSIINVGGLGYGSGFCGDSNTHTHVCPVCNEPWSDSAHMTFSHSHIKKYQVTLQALCEIGNVQIICLLGWCVMGAESDNAVDISAAEDRNHSCAALHVHADDSSTIVRSDFYCKRMKIFKFFGSIPLL